MQRPLSQAHLTRLNLGQRYFNARLSEIPDDNSHKEILYAYCRNLHTNFEEGWGLYLWGDNSRGKTYAACAVLQIAARASYTAYCLTCDKLRAAYIDREMFDPDMRIARRVETVDFLLLEDMGTEYAGKNSEWSQLCLENLLRTRTRNLRPTIVTTNFTPKAFKDRYKKSAFAILLECLQPVHVDGPDWRLIAANKKMSGDNG